MRYLSSVDGLRAIAVILVVLFHVDFSYLPAGYVGVDVFFVISGFLITSIILTKVEKGNFTFRSFYLARIKRIYPAYVVVLLLALSAASYLFVPDDYVAFLRLLRDSALMISNFQLISITTDYFAPNQDMLPLLHTWSLAVEWQFYLVWPLIIVALSKCFDSKTLFKFLIGIFITSLLYSVCFALQHPEKAYLSTVTRITPLLLGSLLFWLRIDKFKELAAIVGMLLIVLSAVFIPSGVNYIAGFYMIPSIGAFLLILSLVSGQDTNIAKFLSLKPVTTIGAMSFSIYLWHWPIYSFCKYVGYKFSTEELLMYLLVVLSISYFSYKIIESPFRKNKLQLSKSIVMLIVLPYLVAISMYSFARSHEGLPERLGEKGVRIEHALHNLSYNNNPDCMVSIYGEYKTGVDCHIGASKGIKKAVMLGDSHANHFRGFVDMLAKDANIRVDSVSFGECAAFPEVYTKIDGHKFEACYEKNKQFYSQISEHYDYVILSQRWKGYGPSALIDTANDVERHIGLEQGLRKALDSIVEQGALPVLIKPVPENGEDLRHCYYQHIKQRREMSEAECSLSPLNGEAEKALEAMFTQLTADYPQLILIDPKDFLCGNGKCKVEFGGVLIYEDEHHINGYASEVLGKKFLESGINPLKG